MTFTLETPPEAAPWIRRLARLGFGAKAVLYATVGLLAFAAGRRRGDHTVGTRGALDTVFDLPLGRAMIVVIAAGLLGYAVWRVVQGITDPERRGRDFKGVAVRTSFVARGVVHGALAVTAFRLAAGLGGRQEDGQQIEQWTARLLGAPAGETLVLVAGASVIGYGVYQLYRAAVAKLSRQLRLQPMSARTSRWIVGVSRFGIGARGVIFCFIGLLLIRAANRHDASQAGGVGDSLRELIGLGGLGRWPMIVTALGLIAYGGYELVNARYRNITVA